VYLEKTPPEFSARDQKQGSTSCSSADENGFGLPLQKLTVPNVEPSDSEAISR
jgi:hypothetical protein